MSHDPLWAPTVPTVTPPSTPVTGADVHDVGASPSPTATPVPSRHEPPREVTQVMPAIDRPEPTAVGGHRGDVRPAGRTRRIVVRVLVATVAIGMGYFLVTLYQVWNTGRSNQARPVDAIVVLGAAQYDGRPSPQLQGRLDEVVRLWPQGYAPLVVVTGGKQPGDRFTEAEASARYLIERGVPEAAIVYENEGATTYESLEATAAILADRGLDRVLLVTDPFHSLRSQLIAREVGMEAYVAPTSTSVLSGSRSAALHVKEAGGVAIARVIGFERLSGLTG